MKDRPSGVRNPSTHRKNSHSANGKLDQLARFLPIPGKRVFFFFLRQTGAELWVDHHIADQQFDVASRFQYVLRVLRVVVGATTVGALMTPDLIDNCRQLCRQLCPANTPLPTTTAPTRPLPAQYPRENKGQRERGKERKEQPSGTEQGTVVMDSVGSFLHPRARSYGGCGVGASGGGIMERSKTPQEKRLRGRGIEADEWTGQLSSQQVHNQGALNWRLSSHPVTLVTFLAFRLGRC